MSVDPGVTYTRTTIREEGREYHRVGDLDLAMGWVRGLGHEARDRSPDGFRYRSVYPGGSVGNWWWVEPGQWICHMTGTDSDSELDCPMDEPHLFGRGWYPDPGEDDE